VRALPGAFILLGLVASASAEGAWVLAEMGKQGATTPVSGHATLAERAEDCGTALLAVGYQEVEKCKVAAVGTACVTDKEIAHTEAEEKRR